MRRMNISCIERSDLMTSCKKILRNAAVVLVCIALTVLMLPTRSFAASAVVWDGKTQIKSGQTYYVLSEIKVRTTVNIPSDSKISVRDGGKLTIAAAGKIVVRGELSVAIGGTIMNYGTLSVKQEGRLNIYGSFQSSVSATIGISGSMTVYNRGVFEASSTVNIYKNSSLYIKGIASFYKSSEVKMSGTITTTDNSTLELRGIMAISLNGVIYVNGHITVGAASSIKCSGSVTLNETATFTRLNTIMLTKSGKFTDLRPVYEYTNMTVNILLEEPNVIRKGVDVSYAQGDSIDWQKVADSGIDFAIIRAARGYISDEKPMAEDVCFRRNIEEAQKYGIDVGVYFYSYASSVSEARAEAEFMVNVIKDYQIQYPVVYDVEEPHQEKIGAKKLTNMVEAFFEVLMENGYYPMLYSSKNWVENYLDKAVVDKYALWLAQWSDEVTYDGGYYIWQYTYKGKVSGITTKSDKSTVDMNISYKDWPTIFRKYHLNNM